MNPRKTPRLLWMILFCAVIFPSYAYAQKVEKLQFPVPGGKTLLNSEWMARRANEILIDGNTLTRSAIPVEGWMPARVPGTVLTTMLENNMFPAPEFSVNNNLIPDIYHIGNDYYTFWFVKQFETAEVTEGQNVWLNFRGINYKADIYLNGKRVNNSTHVGMFLRKSFNITPYLKKEGLNVLAVIVWPPDYPGNPNGGQGGDGTIARNVTMQFTPGWDWIQPVRDRNTGIWDEVSITVTGAVKIMNPYVVTKVPGVRMPEGAQKDAIIKTTIEVENATGSSQSGNVICETNGIRRSVPVTLRPGEKREVAFPDITVKNPRLWWPNGIGAQELYDMTISFEAGGKVSDSHSLRYGIREIATEKDPHTGGRKFYVNGQPIYMPGGNYIASDWMLRLSPERYRAEVRFHAEANLRMIRIWGGALLERPEFYEACDEFGMLVFQDLWGSGDCNGAWVDPMKLESRERRQEYPDDHDLFLRSAEDQIKMIRNHPSLCMWCGGNEWPLAVDIDSLLRTEVMPRLDPNRLFASYSTDDAFTKNLLGDNGDGPYGMMEPEWFFTFQSHPFNPEAGSVGFPEFEGIQAIMSPREMIRGPHLTVRAMAAAGLNTSPAPRRSPLDAAWTYHKNTGYGTQMIRYGTPANVEEYAKYAQLLNYDQYRSFMEGWASHLWDWYTGILIWKTQNPWTALRGQLYDWFLDVNATLYGTRKGCEPLHPFYNLATKNVELLNTTVSDQKGLIVKAVIYDLAGKILWEKEEKVNSKGNTVQPLFPVDYVPSVEGAYFLKLVLLSENDLLTDNIYWLTTKEKDYTALNSMPKNKPIITSDLKQSDEGYTCTVKMKSTDGISFFNRIKVFDRNTGERLLPAHYSENYITLMPGDERIITIDLPGQKSRDNIQIVVDSWTSDRIEIL